MDREGLVGVVGVVGIGIMGKLLVFIHIDLSELFKVQKELMERSISL